ncbi:MAG: hypothetical protein AVDCRST_MAG89-1817, partial [uncultured Gemmatimonadetes bacterium]
ARRPRLPARAGQQLRDAAQDAPGEPGRPRKAGGRPRVPHAVRALHPAHAAAPADAERVPRHARRGRGPGAEGCAGIRAGQSQGRGRQPAHGRFPARGGGHRDDPPGAGHLRHVRGRGRAHRRAAAERDRPHLPDGARPDATRLQRTGAGDVRAAGDEECV